MKISSALSGCLLVVLLFGALDALASEDRRPSSTTNSVEIFAVAIAGLATGRQLARWRRQ
jgi:hypothetical protein